MMRTTTAFLVFIIAMAQAAGARPIGTQEIQVSDGDTIYARGKSYRLIGFNAPETYRAKCEAERVLGERATARLQAIIDEGRLDLTEVTCSCAPGTHGTKWCNFGRSCARLTAKGMDVGEILVREGLARRFVCGKYRCPQLQSWCD